MSSAVKKMIEQATEGSRELDAAVWLAIFEPKCQRYDVEFHVEQYDNHISRTAMDCDLGTIWVDQMDPPLFRFTESMDAALALVARLHPTFFWRVQKQAPDYDIAPFWAACGPHGKHRQQHTGHGATPVLALLSALLEHNSPTKTVGDA